MSEVCVVGIGADGFTGLSAPAQRALHRSEVIIGSSRQLDLLGSGLTAELIRLPSPLRTALPALLGRFAGRAVAVLASGDPMFFGIGSTLVELLGADQVRVISHPSSLSLAAARLGWALDRCALASIVGRPVERLQVLLGPGRRLLVLGAGPDSAAVIGAFLVGQGYGSSLVTVLSELGGPAEDRRSRTAADWVGQPVPALHVLAVECRTETADAVLGLAPGLPDEAYEHDGQLTKRDVRAITVSRLAPVAGELLWDIGAGAGSIAIEWARADPDCRAVAVEQDEERADRIERNCRRLGVPDVAVVRGAAPAALAELPRPDAVFIGGGLTVPGLIDAAWQALAGAGPGGRLVANAVTLESEAVLRDWQRRVGGELTRIELSRPTAVGGFTAWRAAFPVVQWVARR
jgi:precorrin-6Y C5,15-methyltransferase (decarboxylating)